MTMERNSCLLTPKIELGSHMEDKTKCWKRKRSTSEEDEAIIILSSSDDDDDDDDDGVIVISDSEDNNNDSSDSDDVFAKDKRIVVSPFKTEENNSDDELPDIFIQHSYLNFNNIKKEKDSNESCNLDEFSIQYPKDKHIDIEVEAKSFPESSLLTNNSKTPIDLSNVRRNMFHSLMSGGLEEVQDVCCMNPELYVCTHNRELVTETPVVQTGLIIQSIIETQIKNEEKLQSFAIRSMLRTVSKNTYLNMTLANLLIEVLVGSDSNVTSLPEFYIGCSILNKMLFLHPPYKAQMRQYYLKLATVWFQKLLSNAEAAMEEDFPQETERNVMEGNEPPSDSSEFNDIAETAWLKQQERKKRYLSQSKQETLERVTVLLKFFTDLFKTNTTFWLLKHWSVKCCPFRADISPILSQVTWKERNNFGCLNQTVKKIFRLFAKSSEVGKLHEICRVLITLYSVIIQRQEQSCMPYMGPISREYAQNLYTEIKDMPKLGQTLSNLKPEWLKFHVISQKLCVVQPPNFFKVKEVIVKTLRDIQGGKFEAQSEEKVCFLIEAIRSMIGMLQLNWSIIPQSCKMKDGVMEDDNLWFKESLNLESISEHIQTIVILLKSVEGKEHFIDAFGKWKHVFMQIQSEF